jgi:glycosyltransferase involved in cell wall biosynthesis
MGKLAKNDLSRRNIQRVQLMKLSVILSTYNSPEWLKKVLWGYLSQTEIDFEIVIADDGSNDDTGQLIQSFQGQFKNPIIHVWHEDQGFRKTLIMNKAVLQTNSEYLLFSDGDCIPRNDFVATHLKYREQGYFLSGGYYKLPMNISELIDNTHIKNQHCFDLKWLKSHGISATLKNLKFVAKDWKLEIFLNSLTTTKASWNGHGASGWKSDLVKVNGFDERMEWGAEDREMGERLWNSGIKSKQIRYSAICVHLDHSRGYVRQEAIDKNMEIWRETKKLKKTYTSFGIEHNQNQEHV